MKDIMYVCIILYNMNIEDENDDDNLKPLFQMERLVILRRGLTLILW
jgi:hypothetical protein